MYLVQMPLWGAIVLGAFAFIGAISLCAVLYTLLQEKKGK